MKAIVAGMALVSVFGSWSAAEAADEASKSQTQSVVRGDVKDVEGNPVSGVEAILRSEDGAELARATTDSTGAYDFGCIDMGDYQYEIVAGDAFKGHTVVAPVGPNGLAIAWAVDGSKPALASATATGGACKEGMAVAATSGAAGAEGASGAAVSGTTGTGSEAAAAVFGGAAIAGGAGVGIAAGVGAFDSSSDADSPAQ